MTKSLRLVVLLLVFSAFWGCKSKTLPYTNLKPSKLNKEIVATMSQYQRALIGLDAEGILALTAKDFTDTNGTEDPSDDYGYDALQEKLEASMARTKSMRFSFHIQDVKPDENIKGQYQVVYYFTQHAKVAFPTGEDKWLTLRDVNQMTLRKKGKKISDGFEIVKGL